MNGKILPEFDPLKGNEISPESLGFFYYFLYLSKTIEKLVLEKLTEPSISTNLSILSFDCIYVPNTTKIILKVYKMNKKLIKFSKKFEDYLVTNKNKFEKDEELYKIVSNEKLRNKCINNPYFVIHVMMKNKLRMELISNSYNDFKYILNSLNFVMNEYKSLISLSSRIDQNIE